MRLKHVAFVLFALCCNVEAATSDEQFSVIPASAWSCTRIVLPGLALIVISQAKI